MLTVEDLEVRYGRVTALRGASIRVGGGEFVGLIGPNGAGKTTLVSAIAGVVATAGGTIELEGVSLDGMLPEKIVGAGVSVVPEGRQIFARLTVAENLELGATIRTDRAEVAADLEGIYQRLPVLRRYADQLAGKLSGGEQQMLAVARAMIARPRLLILDEPSLGLAPLVIDDMFAWLRELHAQGITILLVEQNAAKTIAAADRTYVLGNGRVERELARGDEVDPDGLVESYLGTRVEG